jgi:hypothetical protein
MPPSKCRVRRQAEAEREQAIAAHDETVAEDEVCAVQVGGKSKRGECGTIVRTNWDTTDVCRYKTRQTGTRWWKLERERLWPRTRWARFQRARSPCHRSSEFYAPLRRQVLFCAVEEEIARLRGEVSALRLAAAAATTTTAQGPAGRAARTRRRRGLKLPSLARPAVRRRVDHRWTAAAAAAAAAAAFGDACDGDSGSDGDGDGELVHGEEAEGGAGVRIDRGAGPGGEGVEGDDSARSDSGSVTSVQGGPAPPWSDPPIGAPASASRGALTRPPVDVGGDGRGEHGDASGHSGEGRSGVAGRNDSGGGEDRAAAAAGDWAALAAEYWRPARHGPAGPTFVAAKASPRAGSGHCGGVWPGRDESGPAGEVSESPARRGGGDGGSNVGGGDEDVGGGGGGGEEDVRGVDSGSFERMGGNSSGGGGNSSGSGGNQGGTSGGGTPTRSLTSKDSDQQAAAAAAAAGAAAAAAAAARHSRGEESGGDEDPEQGTAAAAAAEPHRSAQRNPPGADGGPDPAQGPDSPQSRPASGPPGWDGPGPEDGPGPVGAVRLGAGELGRLVEGAVLEALAAATAAELSAVRRLLAATTGAAAGGGGGGSERGDEGPR